MKDRIESPCVDVCQLDAKSNICMGCFRTMQEITDWVDMPDSLKREVLVSADRRRIEKVKGN